jgi:hypothetical protein
MESKNPPVSSTSTKTSAKKSNTSKKSSLWTIVNNNSGSSSSSTNRKRSRSQPSPSPSTSLQHEFAIQSEGFEGLGTTTATTTTSTTDPNQSKPKLNQDVFQNLEQMRTFYQSIFEDIKLSEELEQHNKIATETLSVLSKHPMKTKLQSLEEEIVSVVDLCSLEQSKWVKHKKSLKKKQSSTASTKSSKSSMDVDSDTLPKKQTQDDDEDENEEEEKEDEEEEEGDDKVSIEKLQKSLNIINRRLVEITKLQKSIVEIRQTLQHYKQLNRRMEQTIKEKKEMADNILDVIISMTISTILYYSGDVRKWDCAENVSINLLPLPITSWVTSVKSKIGNLVRCDYPLAHPQTQSTYYNETSTSSSSSSSSSKTSHQIFKEEGIGEDVLDEVIEEIEKL